MSHSTCHFLGLKHFPVGAGSAIFAQAREYKKNRFHFPQKALLGQTWVMIFAKASTRTRVSFEVGIRELGGNIFFLNPGDIQLSRGEKVRDTARVIGRLVQGAIIRTFSQEDLEDFAYHARIPTINALTHEEHPCQVLTDIFTYEEKRGPIVGKKVAFIGDANNNMAKSWAYAAEYFKFDFWYAAPPGYACSVHNAHVYQADSPEEAARNADLLSTDVWVSMGDEKEAIEREAAFQGYQVNHDLVAVAHPDVLVLHCLPAHRNKEISATLFEERAEDIFDQAENRLHVQKGILHWLMHGITFP